MLVNSLLYYYCFWCALLLLPHMMKTYSQVVCDSLLPPPDFALRFGSRGVSAFDTRKPITAPMTIAVTRLYVCLTESGALVVVELGITGGTTGYLLMWLLIDNPLQAIGVKPAKQYG